MTLFALLLTLADPWKKSIVMFSNQCFFGWIFFHLKVYNRVHLQSNNEKGLSHLLSRILCLFSTFQIFVLNDARRSWESKQSCDKGEREDTHLKTGCIHNLTLRTQPEFYSTLKTHFAHFWYSKYCLLNPKNTFCTF